MSKNQLTNGWTEVEITIVKDLNLSNREVSDKIGRTYSAVKQKRKSMRVLGHKKDIGRWKNEDVRFLMENKNLTNEQLAKKLDKTVYQIANKVNRLGLRKETKDYYSDEDIKFLRENYFQYSVKQIAEKLGRSTASVSSKASEIGLKKTKNKNYWSNQDILVLKENWDLPIEDLSVILEKSRKSILYKRAHLNSIEKRTNRKKHREELRSELSEDVPYSQDSVSERYIDLLSIMNIGESFEFPEHEYALLIGSKKMFPEMVFRTKPVDSTTRRCWRLE